MNLTRNRARQIGWAMILIICAVMTLTLTLRVNAVKSQVQLAERKIVALKQQKLFLETEFETRANQQQLKNLNDVEFGYTAPSAAQYLENERDLAAMGKPRGPGAPSPIRVASAAQLEEGSAFPSMVSPLTGRAEASEIPAGGVAKQATAAGLKDRLSHIGSPKVAQE